MLQIRQVLSLETSQLYLPFCRHIIPVLHFISMKNIFSFYPFHTHATILFWLTKTKETQNLLSDVLITSVHSEKTRINKMIMIIDGFSRAPDIDFRYEIKARKVMVDW